MKTKVSVERLSEGVYSHNISERHADLLKDVEPLYMKVVKWEDGELSINLSDRKKSERWFVVNWKELKRIINGLPESKN